MVKVNETPEFEPANSFRFTQIVSGSVLIASRMFDTRPNPENDLSANDAQNGKPNGPPGS